MIQIRALQHYLYCPHRWGMLHIEGLWNENSSTVKSELGHVNVHSDKLSHVNRNKVCCTDVTVYSETLGIYGKVDMLEFVRSESGAYIDGLGGRYFANVIEYKPTAPKNTHQGGVEADHLQLYAQCRCVGELFKCEVAPYILYIDAHRRVKVEFSDVDFQNLVKAIGEIDAYMRDGIVPKAEYGTKCSGCSMIDTCMPRLKSSGVKKKILEID